MWKEQVDFVTLFFVDSLLYTVATPLPLTEHFHYDVWVFESA